MTVFKAQTGSTFYWQSETTSSDITHYFRQGTSDRAVFGYDDSVDDFVFALRQTGSVSFDNFHHRFKLTQYAAYIEGYQNGALYIVGGSDITTRTATIQMIAASAGDSSVAFRQSSPGVNAFVIGYDDSNNCFQINDDSTSFTSMSSSVLSIVRGSSAWYFDLPQITTSTNYTRWNSADNKFGWYSSDRSLKTNIRPLEVDALGILSKFNPQRFDWKKDGSPEIGWIAQDGVEHIPEMFPRNEKLGVYSLNEYAILPIYHKAIQELKAEIDELKKQLNNEKS